MPKAIPPPQLPSRILNSKGGSALSSSATGRTNSSRNSNLTSTQQRRHSSPIPVTHKRQTNRRAPATKAQGSSSLEGLDSEDDDLPPTKTRRTSKSTKVTTAKEKRQATLAAAEENAARLTAGTEGEDSGEEDEFGTDGNNVDRLEAVYFGNASDDDVDDEEEGPETIHRPRLTKKQTILDPDSDGAAGLDNNDSDEDDPANSPMRQGSKKGKSAGAKFTDATATTITSKLPAKKIPTKQKTMRQASNISEGLASPTKTGTVAPSSSPTSTASAPSPKTPPKPTANSNKPRMGDQTPSTFGLLKASTSDIRQDLFIKDAFPDHTIFTETCKATFLAACADIQATLHRKRFLKSSSYRGVVLNILRQKLSQTRQEARNAALAKAAIHYGVSSTMDSVEILTLVERLKRKSAYVFGDIDRYKQPYANPIIQILINTLFFEGKRKSDAIANPAPWNPMPLPVIALMATAIHSVLDDWSTGKNNAAKNKFSHDNYALIYREHLANLDKFKQKAPAALSKLQVSLWEKAWLSSGSALPDQAYVSIDDDVFEEAEAEALA